MSTIDPASPEDVAWLNRTPHEILRAEIEARTRITDEGCWDWSGYRDRDGYGHWQRQPAHRAVWKIMIGPIPEGHHLHHICRNPGCVNPAHLAVVSPEEHSRLPRRRRRCCPNGHPYTPTTTGMHPGGSRRCLICDPLRPKQPRASATHCGYGHLKTPETWRVYTYPYGVRTVCLTCLAERYAAKKRKNDADR